MNNIKDRLIVNYIKIPIFIRLFIIKPVFWISLCFVIGLFGKFLFNLNCPYLFLPIFGATFGFFAFIVLGAIAMLILELVKMISELIVKMISELIVKEQEYDFKMSQEIYNKRKNKITILK